jgi:hypothetical protein
VLLFPLVLPARQQPAAAAAFAVAAILAVTHSALPVHCIDPTSACAALCCRPGSSPQLLLRVLSDALQAGSYLGLQQQLLMRGLLQEMDIPCTFESEQQQQEAIDSSQSSADTGSAAAAAAAAAEDNSTSSSSVGNAESSLSSADGYDDYGVYKQLQSSADQQQQPQQQQGDNPKGRKLSKSAARRQHKRARKQQQQQRGAAASAWGSGFDPVAHQQQQQQQQPRNYSELWGEPGQYSPWYDWHRHNLQRMGWNPNSSSSSSVGPWGQQSALDSAFWRRAAADAQDAQERAVDAVLGGFAAQETWRQQRAVDAGFGWYEDAPEWQWAANAAFDEPANEAEDAQEEGVWQSFVRKKQRWVKVKVEREDGQEEEVWQRRLKVEREWVKCAGLGDDEDEWPSGRDEDGETKEAK